MLMLLLMLYACMYVMQAHAGVCNPKTSNVFNVFNSLDFRHTAAWLFRTVTLDTFDDVHTSVRGYVGTDNTGRTSRHV